MSPIGCALEKGLKAQTLTPIYIYFFIYIKQNAFAQVDVVGSVGPGHYVSW